LGLERDQKRESEKSASRVNGIAEPKKLSSVESNIMIVGLTPINPKSPVEASFFPFFPTCTSKNTMKLVRKFMEKDGSGSVTLRPEEDEDMWHAYNLIQEVTSLIRRVLM
jgi:eRF1 domain 1